MKNTYAKKLDIVERERERAIFNKIKYKFMKNSNKDRMLYNRTREEFVLLYDVLSFL